MMAALEDGCSYDLDVPWPLHQALTRLSLEDKAVDYSPEWEIPLAAVDDVGTGVPGLDGVLLGLAADRLFVQDPDRARRLRLAEYCRQSLRRQVLRCEPAVSQRLYRAARLWATESSTVSKNFDTAAWSVPPAYWVSPPKPRHAPVFVR